MKLPSAVTLEQAPAVHQQLQAAVAQHGGSAAFGVDAAGLQDLDTSGLAVLLAAHRAAQAKGLGFVIQGAPSKLNQLAALYGVSALLGLQANGM
jgi:phospholipid transport system transporter-binding protein